MRLVVTAAVAGHEEEEEEEEELLLVDQEGTRGPSCVEWLSEDRSRLEPPIVLSKKQVLLRCSGYRLQP